MLHFTDAAQLAVERRPHHGHRRLGHAFHRHTRLAPADPGSYDLTVTIVSAVPAILASALALHLMGGRRNHHMRIIGGGALIGAGIGIGLLPADQLDKDALVKVADEAMYEAKRAGGNRMSVRAA